MKDTKMNQEESVVVVVEHPETVQVGGLSFIKEGMPRSISTSWRSTASVQLYYADVKDLLYLHRKVDGEVISWSAQYGSSSSNYMETPEQALLQTQQSQQRHIQNLATGLEEAKKTAAGFSKLYALVGATPE